MFRLKKKAQELFRYKVRHQGLTAASDCGSGYQFCFSPPLFIPDGWQKHQIIGFQRPVSNDKLAIFKENHTIFNKKQTLIL
ncbi:hypothetical protein C8N47_103182 [Mangrovibacterium marinum]|uniref:Uncharacterized protein n=1 Tax=Mangrovibacterium marinum TaxID=1639118 RepID=A0A2T5C4T5_9BACT|nr:hypothetical protein C8N47_103182 [Mangrovibacterium marinum]